MKIIAFLVAFLLFFPLASSMMVFNGNLDTIYNVGDKISVNLSVLSVGESVGFLDVNLNCGEDKFLLYKNYLFLEDGEHDEVFFDSPLLLSGNDCFLSSSFSGEISKSETFDVSDKILLDLSLSDKGFSPGEVISINGTIRKASGEAYEGAILVSLSNLTEKSYEVVGGVFEGSLFLENDLPSGVYPLRIEAVERDISGDILNKGLFEEEISLYRKPTSIKMSGNSSLVRKGQYNYSVYLLDQSGESMENLSIILKLFDPEGNLIVEKSILSGENFSFEFLSNTLKGGWKLNSYYGSLFNSKVFYVGSNRELGLRFTNHSIIFSNIGNVPYEGNYLLNFSNSSSSKIIFVNLSLSVGEDYEYALDLEGEYNVTSEGGALLGSASLTGFSIFQGERGFDKRFYLILGGVLFLLLALFLYFIFFYKDFSRSRANKKKGVPLYEKEIAIGGERGLLSKNDTSLESVEKKRIYYCLFVKAESNLQAAEEILKQGGFELTRVRSNMGYLLLKPNKTNFEETLFDLASKIKNSFSKKGEKSSIVLSMAKLKEDVKDMKSFALFNRRLLDLSRSRILMSQKFYDRLGFRLPVSRHSTKLSNKTIFYYLL